MLTKKKLQIFSWKTVRIWRLITGLRELVCLGLMRKARPLSRVTLTLLWNLNIQ